MFLLTKRTIINQSTNSILLQFLKQFGTISNPSLTQNPIQLQFDKVDIIKTLKHSTIICEIYCKYYLPIFCLLFVFLYYPSRITNY